MPFAFSTVTRKAELAQNAKNHIQYMEENHGREISESIVNTELYSPGAEFSSVGPKDKPETVVCDMSLVEAAKRHKRRTNTCILNPSSYRNRGGLFLKGHFSQEEELCHESALYNVLDSFRDFYSDNKNNLNHGFYTNRALYSPSVPFDRPDEDVYFMFDVLTCAAPNLSAASQHDLGENIAEINSEILMERIDFIKGIVEEQGVETFVLGAWGCGNFGQDENEVAQLFSESFSVTTVKKIVFAIPRKKNAKAYTVFKKYFG